MMRIVETSLTKTEQKRLASVIEYLKTNNAISRQDVEKLTERSAGKPTISIVFAVIPSSKAP